jgi:hypothetical protein
MYGLRRCKSFYYVWSLNPDELTVVIRQSGYFFIVLTYMSCARFLLCIKDRNVNGKFHPRTGHEGPEGE